MYHDLGVKVTLLEYLPQIVPLEDREVSQALERSFTQARHDGDDERPLRSEGGQGRRRTASASIVGPEGKEAGGAPRRAAARRHGPRPNIEDIGLETTKVETERGFVKVDGHDADAGAARLRDRRRRRRADARPYRRPRGHRRRPHDRRRQGRPPDRLRQAAAGDLLPPGDRLGRAHRAAVPGARARRSRSARSRSRRSPRRSSAASTRASRRSSATRRPTTRSGSTSSARTRPTSSPRRRSRSSSRRRPGRSAARPTRTRRCPRSSARRRMAVDGRSINF